MWWTLEPDSFIEAVASHQGPAQHVRSRRWCMMCVLKTIFLYVNVYSSMYYDKTEGGVGGGVN